MFTGIVEETGFVKTFNKNSKNATLCISCKSVLEDIKIGDSISVNGVCTTVINYDNSSFVVEISEETLNVSNFCNLKINDKLNLERALTLNSRLGGHIVSGHIDCTGKVIEIEKLSNFYNLKFELPQKYMKYIVYKGSITINGVSLTVAKVNDNNFTVAIIPHTYNNTNFKNLTISSFVNIETDILGRYVEKLLSANDNVNNESQINMDFLKENGFV